MTPDGLTPDDRRVVGRRAVTARTGELTERAKRAWGEAKRLKRMKPQVRKKLLRLVVHCDTGTCQMIRVYGLSDGLLAVGRFESQLDDELAETLSMDAKTWSNLGFALWLDDMGTPSPIRSVTCACQNTQPTAFNVDKLQAVLSTSPTRRRIGITDLA